VLRTDMAGHRVVTVLPPEVNFAAQGIARVEARLAYDDAESALHFEDEYTFTGPGEARFFEYDYVAADRSGYSCRLRTVLANGLVQERDLGSLDVDRLRGPGGHRGGAAP